MKKATARTTVIILLLVVLVVGYYAYLSNRSRESREENAFSQVQATLSRDLSKDYPPTPKEVVKYYNEILRGFYYEDSSEDEVEALGIKARELYDEELLEANEIGTYLVRLQGDVQTYRDKERRITGFNLASSNNVEFFDRDGFSFAKIMCGYNIMQDGQTYTTNLMYLLRKDENKRWKIYGWEDAQNLED
ncbi:MAG: hypothetical protein NC079_04470 [Clostridium sp.]|nr:hypothetical protein [Acetatifactor muris]MCM1526338.1 hypothetical protein [Bacteroides sp.]MCM1562845.1 hypothetical protein [Clostridium sp.]